MGVVKAAILILGLRHLHNKHCALLSAPFNTTVLGIFRKDSLIVKNFMKWTIKWTNIESKYNYLYKFLNRSMSYCQIRYVTQQLLTTSVLVLYLHHYHAILIYTQHIMIGLEWKQLPLLILMVQPCDVFSWAAPLLCAPHDKRVVQVIIVSYLKCLWLWREMGEMCVMFSYKFG